MNRKRLAVTAAVIGAVTCVIANPILTGRLPYCRHHAPNLEVIRQQNDMAPYFKNYRAPDPSSPRNGAVMADSLDYEAGTDPPLQPPLPRSPHPDPFAPVQTPDYLKTAASAFRHLAFVLRAFSSLPGNEPTPNYNPLDTLRGTPHEGDDLEIYAGSYNEAHTRALMARQEQDTSDLRTLATSWVGTADCSDLVVLFVSVLLGAAAAAALSYFGPRLLARLVAGLIALWLRWLRWVR